jgi:hypothetical protein
MTTQNARELTTYKMFDSNFKCRYFQYEVGETYKTDKVKACSSGFHACEFPLDCFNYYSPATSKFAEVVQSGEISKHGDDSKVASAEIYIKVELSLPQFIGKAVDYILAKIDWNNAAATNTGDYSAATNTGNQSAATNTGNQSAATNTGNQSAATNTGDYSAATNTGNQSAATNTGNLSAATNTGDYSAATNTGDYSAATNTGNRSAATNTGDYSAATNTGNQSAATNTGYYSAATNTGNQSAATNTGNRSAATVSGAKSVAVSSGTKGKAKASSGSAIVLVYRDEGSGEILHIKAAIAGRDVEPDVFYTLDSDGNFVKTEETN